MSIIKMPKSSFIARQKGANHLPPRLLVRMGYKKVINIEDGRISWKKNGYPVE